MSERPGTIVREIVIDIPDRSNPFSRRQDPRMGQYVGELMGLLHINEGDAIDVAA
jgi:NitT/TauT family transport system ATP-binding protein